MISPILAANIGSDDYNRFDGVYIARVRLRRPHSGKLASQISQQKAQSSVNIFNSHLFFQDKKSSSESTVIRVQLQRYN